MTSPQNPQANNTNSVVSENPQQSLSTLEEKTVEVEVENSEDFESDEVTIECCFCHKSFSYSPSQTYQMSEVCSYTMKGACSSCATSNNFVCSDDDCHCDFTSQYKCNCGREVRCGACGESFCRPEGTVICCSESTELPYGICARCSAKNLDWKFECYSGDDCEEEHASF